jgi:hypothetical protein
MKDAIFTGFLVMGLIALSIFILGVGTAMWLTFKLLYALWVTVGMVIKNIVFVFGSWTLVYCQ